MRCVTVLFVLTVAAAAGDEWRCARGNLGSTGVVKNKGPKKQPSVKWKREEEGTISTGAALAEGKLIYGVGEFIVACRSQSSGREIWDKKVKQLVVSWPAIIDGWIYFGGQDHVHYRITLADHKEPNSQEAGASIVADACVSGDYYLAGALDGHFYAMGAADGRLFWKRKTGNIRYGAAVSRKRVYVVNTTGVLYAFDLRRGREAWKYEAKAEPLCGPIVSGSTVYLVLPDKVQPLSLKNGAPGKPYDTPGIVGAPAVEKSMLHYATKDGEIGCMDAKTCKLKARFKVVDGEITTPLILARKILYGAAGKTLFAADPKKRKVLWTYTGPESFQPPIVANGCIYVGAGRIFYCLR